MLHLLRLLIYVSVFPHCRACSQAKLKFTQQGAYLPLHDIVLKPDKPLYT